LFTKQIMTLPPTAIVVEALQQIVGPPFVLGVVLLLASRFIYKPGSHLAAVLVFIGSFALGNWLAKIHPPWWPDAKRVQWLPWLASAAAIAGLLRSWLNWNTLSTALWAVVVAVAVIRVVPKDYHTAPLWALPAFALLTSLLGFGYSKLNEKQPGFVVPGLFAAALWSAGLVIIHAQSKSLMDIAMLGSVGLFGIAAVTLFTKADVGAVYPGAAVLLVGTLFAGYHETFSKVPAMGFWLPAVAPLLALVGLIPWVQRRPPWQRVLIVSVPTLIVLGVAVGVAMSHETLAFGDEEY
jgi:hypothetical protein